MPLGIDFLEDFGGFWEVQWRQVGSKIEGKIDLNSKAENQVNASRLAFSWFSAVEVGVKKRRQDRPRQPKTDQDQTRQHKAGF